jgi:hypothetical protein
MPNRFLLRACAGFALIILPAVAAAQSSGQGCPIDQGDQAFIDCCNATPESCFFDFPLYCKGGDASFRIGIDFEASPRQAVYTAKFTDRKVKGKLKAFLVDGRIVPGLGRQAKIGNMKCSDTDTGSSCEVRLEQEDLINISEVFDTEQAILNVAIRKSQNEFCVGKFSNNTEKLAANDRVERSLCTLDATTLAQSNGFSLDGEGFFDPAGYSTDGESHFHMTLSGFPTKRTYSGCIASGANKNGKPIFRKVLDFRSFSADQGDATIYRSLDEEAQAKLNEDPLSYSYDVVRQLSRNDSGLRLGGFGDKSLSQLNKQVSAPSAKKERGDSNKKRKKDRRGKKEKKKKKSNKRSQSVRLASADIFEVLPATSRKSGKENVFSWLAFDPIGDNALFIAKNCSGDVSTKALATITCGASDSPLVGFDCANLASETDSDLRGRVCREIRDDYQVALLRIENLSAGTYSVCFDGVDSGATVSTSGDSGDEFGEVKLTTSTSLASNEAFSLIELGLENLSTVSLSADSSCSSPLAEGSF